MAQLIEFTDEEFEKILALQEQEAFNTVQETVVCAVNSCLHDDFKD